MICQTCRAALRLQRQTPLRLLTRVTAPRLTPISHTLPRAFSSTPRKLSQPIPFEDEIPSMSEAETAIASLLETALEPTELLVQDISGGCGSMYAIDITSAAFKGQSILKQQRMVNAALGEVIKEWHGVQIRTKVPADA
ncbi:Fc.00g106900.m01.CDS01 [Cosmosporella sp. VM-42]